jgi:hypothetical protein
VFNKKYGTWNFLWVEDGRRRSRLIGTVLEYKSREEPHWLRKLCDQLSTSLTAFACQRYDRW